MQGRPGEAFAASRHGGGAQRLFQGASAAVGGQPQNEAGSQAPAQVREGQVEAGVGSANTEAAQKDLVAYRAGRVQLQLRFLRCLPHALAPVQASLQAARALLASGHGHGGRLHVHGVFFQHEHVRGGKHGSLP